MRPREAHREEGQIALAIQVAPHAHVARCHVADHREKSGPGIEDREGFSEDEVDVTGRSRERPRPPREVGQSHLPDRLDEREVASGVAQRTVEAPTETDGYRARLRCQLRGELTEGVSTPVVLGHEITGEVAAVGEDVTRVAIGDNVCIDPLVACGVCDRCRAGRPNLCPDPTLIGYKLNGGFAQYLLAPAKSLHRIDSQVGPEGGILAETLACVINGHDRLEFRAGKTAMVLGAGTVGLLWNNLLRGASSWALAASAAALVASASLKKVFLSSSWAVALPAAKARAAMRAILTNPILAVICRFPACLVYENRPSARQLAVNITYAAPQNLCTASPKFLNRAEPGAESAIVAFAAVQHKPDTVKESGILCFRSQSGQVRRRSL